MTKNIPYLISGTIIGIILFQSVCVAPAVNQLINVDDASLFLSYIWPYFFLINACLCLLSLLLIIYNNKSQVKSRYYTITGFVFMMTCYLIIPIINNAKDVNNEELWAILHLTTVVLTFITAILNILNIFHWKFK